MNMVYVVVCIVLPGKNLNRHGGVGTVETSGSLVGLMVSTLPWNAKIVDSISALGTIFTIFITLTRPVAMTMILYNL